MKKDSPARGQFKLRVTFYCHPGFKTGARPRASPAAYLLVAFASATIASTAPEMGPVITVISSASYAGRGTEAPARLRPAGSAWSRAVQIEAARGSVRADLWAEAAKFCRSFPRDTLSRISKSTRRWRTPRLLDWWSADYACKLAAQLQAVSAMRDRLLGPLPLLYD